MIVIQSVIRIDRPGQNDLYPEQPKFFEIVNHSMIVRNDLLNDLVSPTVGVSGFLRSSKFFIVFQYRLFNRVLADNNTIGILFGEQEFYPLLFYLLHRLYSII